MDIPAVVGDVLGFVKCTYCGESYDLGPPKGTLFVYYPHAEYRYWAHVRESKRHQLVLDRMALHQRAMLAEAGEILNEARKARARERARIKRQEKKNALATGTAGDH